MVAKEMNLAQFIEDVRQVEAEQLYRFIKGTDEAPTLYKAEGRLLTIERVAEEEDIDQTFTFVASEESDDRMGDIIRVAGWELGNFKANPVIQWAHDYRSASIGTAPKVWKTNSDVGKAANGGSLKQLRNTVKFDTADPVAARIAGKVARGIQRTESVGFKPIELEVREDVEGAGSWFGPFDFTKSELLEISIVPIPAHPSALRKALYGETDTRYSIPVSHDKPEVRNDPFDVTDKDDTAPSAKEIVKMMVKSEVAYALADVDSKIMSAVAKHIDAEIVGDEPVNDDPLPVEEEKPNLTEISAALRGIRESGKGD
jgi:hypothetical protein